MDVQLIGHEVIMSKMSTCKPIYTHPGTPTQTHEGDYDQSTGLTAHVTWPDV